MLGVLFLLTGFASQAAAGEGKAFQASLTPDIGLHARDVRIEGLSIGVWSENPQNAFTLGFVSGSTGESSGFSWSFLMNYAESYSGVHWAPVNHAKANFVGWQSGLVNFTEQRFKGLQSAFVNYAATLQGLQLGVVNYARTTDVGGVQVGLANVIGENKWFQDFPDSLAPGMVLVNWRF
jgi:hypothetical protein